MKQTLNKLLIFPAGLALLLMACLPARPVHAYSLENHDPILPQGSNLPENYPYPRENPGTRPGTDENQNVVFASSPNCQVELKWEFEQAVLDLINQERQKEGFQPLSLNANLSQTARQHSAEMACEKYFGHVGSGGMSPFDRIRENKYQFSAAGEIIFAGEGNFFTPEQAMKGWMNSPEHRSALLREHYLEAGVGVIFTPDSPMGGYFTVDFASPLK